MAERRMFAKTIIDSDAFLEMPISSQCLYFHLSMRADDEGFINKPKTIMRMTGTKDDDINVLILRKFIIPFESGIVVIKHWKIHNYIRGDRLRETKYQNEKSLLSMGENNSYTLCQSSDGQVSDNCQHRIGKDRLGKDRLGKDSIDNVYSNVTGNIAVTGGNAMEGDRDRDIDIDIERDRDINTISKDIVSSTFVLRIISEWNSLDLTSKLTKINQGTNRYKMLKARVKQYGEDDIVKAINEVNKSKFLKGQAKEFEITFDWFIKPNNFLKVLEGNYRDKEGEMNGGTGQDNKKSEGKWDKYNFG